MRRRLKYLVTRWELHFYALALTTYAVALLLLVFFFPGVSNLWVSILVLVSGFLSLLAAAASAIKSGE